VAVGGAADECSNWHSGLRVARFRALGRWLQQAAQAARDLFYHACVRNGACRAPVFLRAFFPCSSPRSSHAVTQSARVRCRRRPRRSSSLGARHAAHTHHACAAAWQAARAPAPYGTRRASARARRACASCAPASMDTRCARDASAGGSRARKTCLVERRRPFRGASEPAVDSSRAKRVSMRIASVSPTPARSLEPLSQTCTCSRRGVRAKAECPPSSRQTFGAPSLQTTRVP
jgi:hypothetical protein